MTEFFNPQPKDPPVRLTPKEYHEHRLRLYREQHGMCHECGCWMWFEEASFHHTSTGGMGMKGDDTEGWLCHVGCHPPKKKGE